MLLVDSLLIKKYYSCPVIVTLWNLYIRNVNVITIIKQINKTKNLFKSILSLLIAQWYNRFYMNNFFYWYQEDITMNYSAAKMWKFIYKKKKTNNILFTSK